jgi:hypothetical protein
MMELSRCGAKRDCGWRVLIRESDPIEVDEREDGVLVSVSARRTEPPSYDYRLQFTPEEALALVFMLPAETIAGAVRNLGDYGYNLREIVPEIQKQLSMGLIPDPEEVEPTIRDTSLTR